MTGGHVTDRAWERYGVAVGPDELREMRAQIECRRAVLMDARAGNGCERWMVRLGDRALIAIYSRPNRIIVTVLPPGITKAKRARSRGWKQGAR